MRGVWCALDGSHRSQRYGTCTTFQCSRSVCDSMCISSIQHHAYSKLNVMCVLCALTWTSWAITHLPELRHVSAHEHFDNGRRPTDTGPTVFTPVSVRSENFVDGKHIYCHPPPLLKGLPLGYVVHFINAGYEFWKTKYEILGVFSDGQWLKNSLICWFFKRSSRGRSGHVCVTAH